MPEDEGTPYRRREDCVSYRDMVEYVAESDARYHAARAESLIQISNAMEKQIARIEEAVSNHDKWHRDVLQAYLDRATSNRTGIIAVVVAVLSNVIAVLAVLHGGG